MNFKMMRVHCGEGEDKSKGEIKKVDSLPHHTLLNPGINSLWEIIISLFNISLYVSNSENWH